MPNSSNVVLATESCLGERLQAQAEIVGPVVCLEWVVVCLGCGQWLVAEAVAAENCLRSAEISGNREEGEEREDTKEVGEGG
jgi:hypothetical protein